MLSAKLAAASALNSLFLGLGGVAGVLIGLAMTFGYAFTQGWSVVLPWEAIGSGAALAVPLDGEPLIGPLRRWRTRMSSVRGADD